MGDKVKVYAKALVAFFLALTGFCATIATNKAITDALPAQWVAYLLAIGAAGTLAGGVAAIPNLLTNKQIQGAAVGVAASVAQQVNSQAAAAVQNYVQSAAEQFSFPAKAQVLEIANQLPTVVQGTVDDIVSKAIHGFQVK